MQEFLRRLERSAWTLGSVLLLTYLAACVWSEGSRIAAVQSFERAYPTSTAPADLSVADLSVHEQQIDKSLWSPQRIAAFNAIGLAEEPEGILRIPALHLTVPLFEGTSERNLNRGAAIIEGTATLTDDGNIGIAAHRDGFFRKLKDIAIGDELHLQTRTSVRRYRVVDLRVVDPKQRNVLAPTSIPSVTLVTCYPFYFVGSAPQRFIVRAELVQAPPELLSASRR